MHTVDEVVEIFDSPDAALRAIAALRLAGVAQKNVQVLMPGTMDAREFIERSQIDEGASNPAAWSAIGSGIGSFVGAAAVSALVPGIGPVLGVGAIAAAFLAGAVGGDAAGRAIEKSPVKDDTRDDFFLFEDALRREKAMLVVRIEDETDPKAVVGILRAAGGRSIDSAREEWWNARRDEEAKYYQARFQSDFAQAERSYRRGYEVGYDRRFHDRSYDQVEADLASYRAGFDEADFRRGFERGATAAWQRLAAITNPFPQQAPPPMDEHLRSDPDLAGGPLPRSSHP
jgi:hypothetical protein